MTVIRPIRSQNGGVLLMVVLLITILSGILAVSLVSTNHYRRLSQVNAESMRLYYAAHSALEKNYADLRGLIHSGTDIEKDLPISVLTESITSETLPDFLNGVRRNYIFNVNTVVPSDEDGSPADRPVDSNPDPFVRDYYFLSASYAQTEGFWRPLDTRLEQPLKYSIRPLFYFGVFHDGDLEIHPVADMELSGRIHANGSIYYGSSGSGSLRFTGHLSAVNGVMNTFHPDRNLSGEPSTNHHTFANQPFLTSGEHLFPPQAFDPAGNNPNHQSAREMIEMPVTVQNNEYFNDDFAENRLFNKAGLKVVVSDDRKTVSFFTKDGTPITPDSGALYTFLIATFKPDTALPDNRLNASVATVRVDMSHFTDSKGAPVIPSTLPANSKFPNTAQTRSMGIHNKTMVTDTNLTGKEIWNGIIYVATKGVSNDKPAGVLLVNGQILPDGGLTVVSPNNLYVAGDYNSGGSGTAIPSNVAPAQTGQSPVTTVKNYSKPPAALIADSITVLSSKWLEQNQSLNNPSQRMATPTTINASMIAGYSLPQEGVAPEGFEHFVKLLENWSGTTLTISGSFVSLYESLEGRSAPGYVHAGEPLRQWIYDPDLQKGKLPPGTPYISTLKKGPVQRVF